MKRPFFIFLSAGALSICILLSQAASAQDKSKEPEDPKKKWVSDLVTQARADIRRYQKLKKDGKEKNPAPGWADILWEYRSAHPGTEAADEAAQEALWILLGARLHDEVIAKANTLKPDDSAWKGVIGPLYSASLMKKDPSSFIEKMKVLLPQMKNKETRSTAQLQLARAFLRGKEKDKAKAAFEAAIAEAPDSDAGQRAKRTLFDMLYLNVGQTVPAFAAKTLDDKPLNIADYRGKVVLLNFWATW